jgi:hypothetical protein
VPLLGSSRLFLRQTPSIGEIDKAEAKRLAAERLLELRAIPFVELVDRLIGRQETDEVTGSSGARYQLEVQGLWDRKEGADLRVMVLVDDGGLRAFAPVSESFIMAPDGSFVGE